MALILPSVCWEQKWNHQAWQSLFAHIDWSDLSLYGSILQAMKIISLDFEEQALPSLKDDQVQGDKSY